MLSKDEGATSGADRLRDLFSQLRRSGSLEGALEGAVRLACECTNSAAGTVVLNDTPPSHQAATVVYDPGGLLSPTGPVGLPPGPDGEDLAASGTVRKTAPSAKTLIPLRCGVNHVGTLMLWNCEETTDAKIRSDLETIDTVLATLLAASSGTCAAGGLLSGPAFRARVAAEMKRAKRVPQEFSVVHVRLGPSGRAESDSLGMESTTARAGEAILEKLRETDAVALPAPDRLAVLLTETSLLGAKIAGGRLARFLEVFDPFLTGPTFAIKSYPSQSTDLDELCRVPDQAEFDLSKTLVVEATS
ncbi:MAG: hypothetical protein GY778_04830 [bacterium]|nr:hypothetical protein [bacterium]